MDLMDFFVMHLLLVHFVLAILVSPITWSSGDAYIHSNSLYGNCELCDNLWASTRSLKLEIPSLLFTIQ